MEQPKKKYQAEGAYRLLQTLQQQTQLSAEEQNGESALTCMRKSHSLIAAFQKEEVEVKPQPQAKEKAEGEAPVEGALAVDDAANPAEEEIPVDPEWKKIEEEVFEGLLALDKKISFIRKIIFKLAKWQNKRALKKIQALMSKADKPAQRRKEDETGD